MKNLPKSHQEMQAQLAKLYSKLQDDSSPESASSASREVLALLDATFAWIENPEISDEMSAIYEKLPTHLQHELRSTETRATVKAHRLLIEDLRALTNVLKNSPFETMFDLVIMRVFGLTTLFFAVNPGTCCKTFWQPKEKGHQADRQEAERRVWSVQGGGNNTLSLSLMPTKLQ